MNITIYYYSKKITLQQKNQSTQNQSFKNLDVLTKKEIVNEFELFINQNEHHELVFETKNMEIGFENFKKAFKYIYAAGGLIKKDNTYLFIYRLKVWDLPKGKLDAGESPSEAAIRECEEECGISKLTITKELQPTYHMYEYKGGYALKKTFWYAMTTLHTGKLIPQIEENIEKVEWLSPEQIKLMVFENTYFAILDVIKEGT